MLQHTPYVPNAKQCVSNIQILITKFSITAQHILDTLILFFRLLICGLQRIAYVYVLTKAATTRRLADSFDIHVDAFVVPTRHVFGEGNNASNGETSNGL